MAARGELATLEDLPGLVEVYFSAFNSQSMQDVFPPTPDGREFIRKMYEKCIKSEPGSQQSKVLIVRDDSRKVACSAAYYIIGPNDGGLWSWRERCPNPPETMSESKLDAFFGEMAPQHLATTKDNPHVFLEILCTMESSRKRGYATLLLEMGNELADSMDYACYLDAAPTAKHLYESLGYVVNNDVASTGPLAMLRPKKSKRS